MTAKSENITLRSDKSSPLTQAEVDQNFQESKNSIDELGRRVVIRKNRGDLKSRDNEVGWYIQLSGLTANDDGRGGLYEVKEPNTGTADDETIISLDNGNQAHLVGYVNTGSGIQSVRGALNQRVIYVDTLADLQALPTGGLVDKQPIHVTSWRDGWALQAPFIPLGGGDFIYDTSRPKSDHNGGTVISPTVPWTTNLRDFLNGDGETDSGGTGCYVRKYDVLTPEDFGAYVVTSATETSKDSYMSFQKALEWLNYVGGGKLYCRFKYLSRYVLFVKNNIEIYGNGPGSEVFFEDTKSGRSGRGGFILGAWREGTPAVGISKGYAGDYTSPYDDNFTENPVGAYLRDNLNMVQAEQSCIHDIRLTPYFTEPLGSGGYAINMANALNCSAWNIWGDGWNTMVNMGSDVSPTTPSCHECHAWNIFVNSPDQVGCYYIIGFMANSTNCSLSNGHAANWSDDDDADGGYTVACEDCHAHDMYLHAGTKTHALGDGGDTRGWGINGGKRNTATNIHTQGLHNCVSITQGPAAAQPSGWEDANIVSGVNSLDTKVADIRMGGDAYGVFEGVNRVSAPETYRITNISGNAPAHFRGPIKRGWTVSRADISTLNDVELGKLENLIAQPGLCDFIDASSFTPFRVTGDASNPADLIHVLRGFHTVKLIRIYGTFAANGVTDSVVAEANLVGQEPHNGNSSEAAQFTVVSSATATPGSDSSEDFTLTFEPRESIFDESYPNYLARFFFSPANTGVAWKSFRIHGWVYD